MSLNAWKVYGKWHDCCDIPKANYILLKYLYSQIWGQKKRKWELPEEGRIIFQLAIILNNKTTVFTNCRVSQSLAVILGNLTQLFLRKIKYLQHNNKIAYNITLVHIDRQTFIYLLRFSFLKSVSNAFLIIIIQKYLQMIMAILLIHHDNLSSLIIYCSCIQKTHTEIKASWTVPTDKYWLTSYYVKYGTSCRCISV